MVGGEGGDGGDLLEEERTGDTARAIIGLFSLPAW